jgi:hypothetical protein
MPKGAQDELLVLKYAARANKKVGKSESNFPTFNHLVWFQNRNHCSLFRLPAALKARRYALGRPGYSSF